MNYKKLLAQSLFWRLSGFITSFILTLAIARVLGPHLSAELNLFIAAAALVVLIANLNVDSAITYFLAGNRLSLSGLINLVVFYCLIAMAAVFVLSVNMDWTNIGKYTSTDLGIAYFIYITGLQVTNFSVAFFYGKQNFNIPGFFISLFNSLQVVFLIVLNSHSGDEEYLLKRWLPVFLAVPFLQGLCLAVYFRLKYVRNYSLSFLPRVDTMKVFRMAILFFLANLLLFLMYRIDYWMLAMFDESDKKLELLGNYIQASKLGQACLLFSSAIGSAIFAGIAAWKGKDPVEALSRTIRLLLSMGLLCYIIFLMIGKTAVTFFYGDAFDHIYLCGLLVLPGIIALMSASVTANYLSGKGFARYNLLGVLFGLFIIVAGDYFFIPSGSIYAAAIVSSTGYFTYAVYMLVIFCSKTKSSWRDILFIRAHDILYLKGIFKRSEI